MNTKQKTSEKNVEVVIKKLKTDKNFRLHKEFKRRWLTKEQMKLFINATEEARLSDLRRGKSKDAKKEDVA